jgi:hypothetical protein
MIFIVESLTKLYSKMITTNEWQLVKMTNGQIDQKDNWSKRQLD